MQLDVLIVFQGSSNTEDRTRQCSQKSERQAVGRPQKRLSGLLSLLDQNTDHRWTDRSKAIVGVVRRRSGLELVPAVRQGAGPEPASSLSRPSEIVAGSRRGAAEPRDTVCCLATVTLGLQLRPAFQPLGQVPHQCICRRLEQKRQRSEPTLITLKIHALPGGFTSLTRKAARIRRNAWHAA